MFLEDGKVCYNIIGVCYREYFLLDQKFLSFKDFLFVILMRNIFSNFSLSSCQDVSAIPEKKPFKN